MLSITENRSLGRALYRYEFHEKSMLLVELFASHSVDKEREVEPLEKLDHMTEQLLL